MAVDKFDKNMLMDELEFLLAIKRVMDTDDGRAVIMFILGITCLDDEPFESSKNSGDTAHILGKQAVGRSIIDKLVEARVSIPISLFSRKSGDRINTLTSEINKILSKEA